MSFRDNYWLPGRSRRLGMTRSHIEAPCIASASKSCFFAQISYRNQTLLCVSASLRLRASAVQLVFSGFSPCLRITNLKFPRFLRKFFTAHFELYCFQL